MEFLDARRLTGPSLIFDGPAAVLDVASSSEEADRLLPVWQKHVEHMFAVLNWSGSEFGSVKLSGGISMAFTVSIDALYAASELNEWAYAASAAELDGAEEPDFEATVHALRASAVEEANPELLAIESEARDRGVTLLWDDDEASLGLGRTAKTWPVRDLPDLSDQDWSKFEDVPIGLVTGTNGKTTTVRLATHICRVADMNVGLSSTDWIAVNDDIIDRGDWSGPGGARAVLRENRVDVAILESARGGLLRRGLGVQQADVALITNIAEDHLGDFGSQNLEELLDIKWIVSRPVRDRGELILNADDRLLIGKAENYPGDVVWFSLDADSPVVNAHCEAGGTAYVLRDGDLIRNDGNEQQIICRDHDIPITLGGAARHNVANSLAAAALTSCMGVSLTDIRAGLTTMSQDSNPGRCNIYAINGTKVLVDFAHNPHAMHALFDMAEALPAARRVLCCGQAGDRPDSLIQEMMRDAFHIGLDRVVVSELAEYHRGREHGDVYAIIKQELMRCGIDESQVEHQEEELDSLNSAIEWANEGDLVIMLALGGAAPIQERLVELGAVPSN